MTPNPTTPPPAPIATCAACRTALTAVGGGWQDDGGAFYCPPNTLGYRAAHTPAPIAPAAATPGPWHVEAGCAVVDQHGNVVASGLARRHLRNGTSGGVYYGCEACPNIEPIEADRNVYLLAAAPELRDALAALSDAYDAPHEVDGGSEDYHARLSAANDAARALLARLGVTL